jgi:hypothetical protein
VRKRKRVAGQEGAAAADAAPRCRRRRQARRSESTAGCSCRRTPPANAASSFQMPWCSRSGAASSYKAAQARAREAGAAVGSITRACSCARAVPPVLCRTCTQPSRTLRNGILDARICHELLLIFFWEENCGSFALSRCEKKLWRY